MTEAYLGVDVGTTATKAVILDARGRVLAAASVGHLVDTPQPGWFEHDPETAWWGGVVAAVRTVLDAVGPDVALAAIGLTSCGPCLLPVDAAGAPLRPGILYGVDTRATDQTRRLESAIGAGEIMAAYGMPLTSQSAGPKIAWLAECEPEVFDRTAKLLTTNGFVAFRLTGRMTADHHQAAYFAPYYRAGRWDPTHDDRGVVDRLPELVWSQEVVGSVTATAAAETGLPAGLPVVLGSSDGLTAAYGAGGGSPAGAVVNYGSTLGLTVMTTAQPSTGGLWSTPGAFAGQACLVGGLATGGALLDWFVTCYAPELAAGLDADRDAVFDHLEAEAATSPAGADGLLLLPYFAGERTPIYDPGAAGVLLGMRLRHGRGDHYRAVLEGTAFGVRHLLDELAGMGVEVASMRAVGGGTRSRLWPQIVSDVTGVPQVAPRRDPGVDPGRAQGAASGAAALAALATGGPIDDDDTTPHSSSRAITPDPAAKPVYDERFAVYRRAYVQTRSLVAALDVGGR